MRRAGRVLPPARERKAADHGRIRNADAIGPHVAPAHPPRPQHRRARLSQLSSRGGERGPHDGQHLAMAPLASIIICTRNRAASLDRTLRGLLDDDSATDRELVIVDNASSDRTRIVAEAAAQTAGFAVVIVSESRPGLSRARNAGVRRASGEFLLFTDDDIVVRPGWVDALVAPFASGDVAVTGGRVIPVHPRPLAPWMRGTHLDRIALIDYGPSDRELVGDAPPYGANFALRRSVLPPEDPFPPFLGHSGAVGISYEEWHVVQSLAREHRIVYAPKAVVEHHYDAAKLDYDSFRSSYFQS